MAMEVRMLSFGAIRDALMGKDDARFDEVTANKIAGAFHLAMLENKELRIDHRIDPIPTDDVFAFGAQICHDARNLGPMDPTAAEREDFRRAFFATLPKYIACADGPAVTAMRELLDKAR